MANEITITVQLSYNNSGRTLSVVESFQASQVGTDYIRGTKDITTAGAQTLPLGSVGTAVHSYVLIKNTHASSYVDIGYADTPYVARLLFGQSMLTPWTGAAIYAKAQTGTVIVEYTIIEA